MFNKFCDKLSHNMLLTNVHSSGEVHYKPCCWYDQDIIVHNKEELDNTRAQLNKVNFWILPCRKCQSLERAGLPSPRTSLPIKDYVSGDQIALELQFDRECNAACITCGEWSSTTWMKYNNKIQNISTQQIKVPDIEKNIGKILSLVDTEKISYISMIGGEPFASETHLKILNLLPEKNLNSITVNYQTNGSIFPTKNILDIFSKLKEVIISFSVDGTEERFNYIRWPLNFRQVNKNIIDFLNLDMPNLSFSLSHTITPLNIFYYDEFIKYRDSLQSLTDKKIFLYQCAADGIMGLQSASMRLRDTIEGKYKDHNISKLLRSKSYDYMSHEKFLNYINFHDQHRNISYKKIFLEVADFL